MRYPEATNLPYGSVVDLRIPYLLTEDNDYPEGLNFFLQEGLNRVAATPQNDVLRKYEVSSSLIRGASYTLLNFINFQEHISQFPELACGTWRNVQPLHTRLYSMCMRKGYWTDEFFATGNAIPLSYASTIRPRISLIFRAWSWMEKEGIVSPWSDNVDEHTARKYYQLLRLDFEARKRSYFGKNALPTRYKKRGSPGDILPLSKRQLRTLLGEVRPGGAHLAILAMYMMGMRLSEIVGNSLMPGENYVRPEHLLNITPHRFLPGKYKLRHDLRDDSMIGVMPSADIAFSGNDVAARDCRYRIVGKGPKVRLVYIPPSLMRLFWHYASREREQILSFNKILQHNRPAQFLLNRFGAALSANAIYRELKRAKKRAEIKLGVTIDVDAHTLRHTYACTYLEAAIAGNAAKDGVDPSNLTLEQIENYGQAALVILQENLGHAELATTMRYLKQLAAGEIGFQFQTLFNNYIEDFLGVDAA
ncbi:tyrosine-type recombinase/integrase [Pararhizobium sp. PWRC1-1]|uniref:tyrosine-type recombinase/integrase n=1 Tax=Pararhizobium sp. PWRC1-1 TaxID=2804566 RepID=UPI003CF73635